MDDPGCGLTCQECASPLLQPIDWAQLDETAWWLEIRCPECFATYDVVMQRPCAERLERMLDDASRQIKHRADRFAASRMAAWADAFATALEADAVQPMDF